MVLRGGKIFSLLIISAVLVSSSPRSALKAQSSKGGAFLPLGWGAKGAGLADAATILINDDRSVYWNPANLSFLQSPRMTLGTTKPIPDMDVRYSVFSAATGILGEVKSPDGRKVMSRGAVGLSFSQMGLTLAQGSNWSESSIGLSASIAPNHYNSLGLTIKILKNWTDVTDAGASGYAIDIGWTALLRNNLYLAAFGRNVSSRIKYPNSSETLDGTWNLAVSYKDLFDIVSIEQDLVLKSGHTDRLLTGVEINMFDNLLFVTTGIDKRLCEGARTIYTLGFGTIYNFSEIALGFRFDPEDAFGRQTILSVSFAL